MDVRISSIEEHTSRVRRVVDGVSETRRPVTSVTIEFKFESGWDIVRRQIRDSRRFTQLMNDGCTYRLRTQITGPAWVEVTYRLTSASANPYGVRTVKSLKERALAAIRQKTSGLTGQN